MSPASPRVRSRHERAVDVSAPCAKHAASRCGRDVAKLLSVQSTAGTSFSAWRLSRRETVPIASCRVVSPPCSPPSATSSIFRPTSLPQRGLLEPAAARRHRKRHARRSRARASHGRSARKIRRQQHERARRAAARADRRRRERCRADLLGRLRRRHCRQDAPFPPGYRVLVLEEDHSSPMLEWHARAEAQGFTVEAVQHLTRRLDRCGAGGDRPAGRGAVGAGLDLLGALVGWVRSIWMRSARRCGGRVRRCSWMRRTASGSWPWM